MNKTDNYLVVRNELPFVNRAVGRAEAGGAIDALADQPHQD